MSTVSRAMSAAVLAPVVGTLFLGPVAGAAEPVLTVAGGSLAGASVASGATVTATAPAGVTEVKFVLDGTYLGTDTVAPFTGTINAAPGSHLLKARLYDAAGAVTRAEASFTVAPGEPVPPTPPPTVTPNPTPTGGTTPSTGTINGVRVVTDSAGLAQALSAARPGAVIELRDGVYKPTKAFTVTTACTATAPCTLRGGRSAVLSGNGISGHYGLHLKGASYWTVSGLTVADAAKGVILDGAKHNTLTGLDVHTIGDEGIHLRSFSSDNVVRSSTVHDTGKRVAGYGEGLYVGSARSNWGTYSGGAPDSSDRNLVTGNRIWNTGAESVDIKEGTRGGTLSNNTFDGTGMSGENYADSWVDLKGNAWVVSGNRGVTARLDGFQTHVPATGWGRNNVFRGNVADTRSAGYGFRLQDASTTSNTVACDNTAASARAGLANTSCR